MGASIVIKYIDSRPLFYPKLKNYPNGIKIEKGSEIKVTEKELKYFLRQRNGRKIVMFEEVKNVKRPAREFVEPKIENVEVD